MPRSLEEIFDGIAVLAAEGKVVNGKIHAMVHPDAGVAAGGATREGSPAAPAPEPTPPAAPAPAKVSSSPIVEGLRATEWLTANDDKTGETAKQPMYSWAPRNYSGCGLVTVGVSVPDHVLPGDGIKVRLAGRADLPWTYGRIIEGGPHYTDDPYLRTGARPRAESAPNNHASLDFTPAFMAKVLGKTPQECYDAELSAMVDAQFVPAAQMPDDAHLVVPAPTHINGAGLGEEIVKAARALPVPFPYAPETRGGNLGCADVVSTALRAAGVPIPIILGVDDVVTALLKLGWKDVDASGYADGCVIVWAAIPESNGHKHIGILAHLNGQLSAINNSSSLAKPIEEVLATKSRPIERVLAPA